MSRPSLDESYLAVAKIWAERSTCRRKKVGCVIVDQNGEQLSFGYNGANHGEDHCLDEGCLINNEGRCIRCNHAEINALLKEKKDVFKGATVYATVEPCENCTRTLAQVGIRRVVYIESYPNPYNHHFNKNMEWQQWVEPKEVKVDGAF
ncbi:dCMP deaminase family protein [Priestia megaterium]